MLSTQSQAHATLARVSLRLRQRMLAHRQRLGKEDVEVALTSELMRYLSMVSSRRIRVAWPEGTEDQHGADVELWILCAGYRVGFKLQAKALKPGGPISIGVYDELDHVIGRGTATAKRQVEVLEEATAPPFNAGYLFYNGLANKPSCETACCRDDEWAKSNGRLGITFTSASNVRDALDSAAFPKRLATMLPRSVPLPCIATCVGLNSTQSQYAREDDWHWRVRWGAVRSDVLGRLPGWVLGALQADSAVRIVLDGSDDSLVAMDTLRGSVLVETHSSESTHYVDRIVEGAWPDGLPVELEGREARGPLIVVDAR